LSLETGKKVNQAVNIRCSPGAAGNVVNNLAALQAVEENCGVLTQTVREYLMHRAKKHPSVLFFADSRSHALSFQHITIKSNPRNSLIMVNFN